MTRPEDKHAWTAKIGSKGQIVIPKDAREIFNFKPGDNVLLLGDEIIAIHENKHARTAKIVSKALIVITKDASEIINFKVVDNVLLVEDMRHVIAIMRSN